MFSLNESRAEDEILKELQVLCTSDGYAEVLAYLCLRDNFICYEGSLKPHDLKDMKGNDRLLRSEITLLIGMMLKRPMLENRLDQSIFLDYLNSTERLLSELHQSLLSKLFISAEDDALAPKKLSLQSGIALKEPIFYAGEYAYMFQYRDFIEQKYQHDSDWLFEKKGFRVNHCKSIIQAIIDIRQEKLELLFSGLPQQSVKSNLDVFIFTVEEIESKVNFEKQEISNFLLAFCFRLDSFNPTLIGIGSYNEANSYPIIPLTFKRYILFQEYSLAESAYETPFFWMFQDKSYRPTATDNRGMFTEYFTSTRLRTVVGDHNVFDNVVIVDKSGNHLGEIDVLVVYADRAIIIQAKSKKLTLDARQGNDTAIMTDFEAAIQKAYDQGYECVSLVLDNNTRLFSEGGTEINVRRSFEEVFIFCVLSEYYPALSHQADLFLKVNDHSKIQPPYIIDVFFLDVLCEVLNTPLHFFNFLHRRMNYNKRIRADNELSILSFHLAHNLWIDESADMVHLNDDFSVHIDSVMLVRREGMPGDTLPNGILTKFKGKFVEYIFEYVNKSEEDHILDIGYFLLGLNEVSLEEFSDACETILLKTRNDGKYHDFSMGVGKKGITVYSVVNANSENIDRLCAHCATRKYMQRADVWYGIIISESIEGFVVLVMGLNFPWYESPELAAAAEEISGTGIYRAKAVNPSFQQMSSKKSGRNDLCPCGSGKKYKKCCL
jgi:hypothetical protein